MRSVPRGALPMTGLARVGALCTAAAVALTLSVTVVVCAESGGTLRQSPTITAAAWRIIETSLPGLTGQTKLAAARRFCHRPARTLARTGLKRPRSG